MYFNNLIILYLKKIIFIVTQNFKLIKQTKNFIQTELKMYVFVKHKKKLRNKFFI